MFFLSRGVVLSLLSETRDPTQIKAPLRHLFNGIHSLEFDDLDEAHAMISGKGERIPFGAPIRTRDARGCVEKWMLQVEEQMKSTVHDVIDGSLESIGSSARSDWAQEWPCQGVLAAEFINSTSLIHEA